MKCSILQSCCLVSAQMHSPDEIKNAFRNVQKCILQCGAELAVFSDQTQHCLNRSQSWLPFRVNNLNFLNFLVHSCTICPAIQPGNGFHVRTICAHWLGHISLIISETVIFWTKSLELVELLFFCSSSDFQLTIPPESFPSFLFYCRHQLSEFLVVKTLLFIGLNQM